MTAWLVLDRSASMRFGTAGHGKDSVSADLVVALARLLTQGGNRVGAILYDNRAHRIVPPDLTDLALDVLRHRLVLSYEALADDVTADAVLQKILAALPVPDPAGRGR